MKKKVLFLVPSFKFGGGAPKVASALTLGLAKKYNISILSLFHYPEEGPLRTKLMKLIQDKRLGNDVILLGSRKNPYKYISKADVPTEYKDDFMRYLLNLK